MQPWCWWYTGPVLPVGVWYTRTVVADAILVSCWQLSTNDGPTCNTPWQHNGYEIESVILGVQLVDKAVCALRLLLCTWTELKWPEQVDPVTRCVHWLHTTTSQLYFQLIGKESVRCNWHSAGSLGWPFLMLKYKYTLKKIKSSDFIKQHSETVMVWNYQNADCSFRKKFYYVIYCNFRHTFVPCWLQQN